MKPFHVQDDQKEACWVLIAQVRKWYQFKS